MVFQKHQWSKSKPKKNTYLCINLNRISSVQIGNQTWCRSRKMRLVACHMSIQHWNQRICFHNGQFSKRYAVAPSDSWLDAGDQGTRRWNPPDKRPAWMAMGSQLRVNPDTLGPTRKGFALPRTWVCHRCLDPTSSSWQVHGTHVHRTGNIWCLG